jgi:hypothetical protein
MTSESRHISISIARPATEVYDYASSPANLPEWAAGLGSSGQQVDGGRWIADSPMGRVVIAEGSGCEVVFTLRRRPGMSDEDFARDADAVTADLATLKRVLERH